MVDRIICRMCGNEIEKAICPYCNTSNQSEYYSPKLLKRVDTVNIKENTPTVEEALRNADRLISHSKMNGIKVLKIIHGYGSTGVGGAIRIAVRQKLRKLNYGKMIVGEEFTTMDQNTQILLNQFPDLKSDSDLNNNNLGVTFFIL